MVTNTHFQFDETTGHYHTDKALTENEIIDFANNLIQKRFERGTLITRPCRATDYIKSRLCLHKHEVFAALFLDSKLRLIEYEELFQGTIQSAPVYQRTVLQRALHHNASTIIFAHNHPSGDPTPSKSDIDITKSLKDTLAIVDVKLVDHIVVGATETRSIAELGHI